MGKPSSSCLKIIACGSDSAVEDGVESPEAKGSGEKRGWSFRKRSGRHRAVSNGVNADNLTLRDKGTTQSTNTGSQAPSDPTIPEKVVVLEHDEKNQAPASAELKPPKSIKAEEAETFDVPKPTVSVEPEESEALDASKPPGSFEPERPDISDVPEPPISIEPEVPEASDTPNPVVSSEPEVLLAPTASLESVVSFEPDVLLAPTASLESEVSETYELNPRISFELKVPEKLDAPKPPGSFEPEEVSEVVGASQSPELVESSRYVLASSESFDIIETEASATEVVFAPEPPADVVSKMHKGMPGPESLVSADIKLSGEVVVSQDDVSFDTVVIQTGIRGFLAQREAEKLKSAIKLQAAVRGHLVRRHAVDTLYCMQGIVKVQTLVRDRQLSRNEASVTKPIRRLSSTEKLLRNGFVRQLLESTPKSKSNVTKCDPLRPNSAWAWLERWMTVSSHGISDLESPETRAEDVHSQAENISPTMECETSAEVKLESVNQDIAVKETSMIFENQKSSISDGPKEDRFYDVTGASFEERLEMAAQQDQILSENLVVKTEAPKISMKRTASEEVDTESKKFAYGSRKASSPAFIAAQSKFEVLASGADYDASHESPRQYSGAEFHHEESINNGKESRQEETLISDATRTNINMGGSECGTELSITSALDSPDQSETDAEAAEIYLEQKYTEKESHESNGAPNPAVAEDSHQPEQRPKAIPSSEQEDTDCSDLKPERPLTDQPVHQPEQRPKAIPSSEQEDIDYTDLKPETAPSDVAEAGSLSEQRTPSSQASVKPKRGKLDKSAKRSSLSGGKKSHSGGAEKPSKDQRSGGKRRNSFGSGKSDHGDQEPRDSTSSTRTLPSYMQATESAKLKAASSPRSSPDVYDKEAYALKKRHSLPGAGGRQGSPRIQRPTAQATQVQPVKGSSNAGTPPQERRWVR